MTQLYFRKPEAIHAEVITPELYEKLQADQPGLLKYASVGDYVWGEPPKGVIKAEALAVEYEHEDARRERETAPVRDALDQIAAIGKRVHDMDVNLSKLTAPQSGEKAEAKPQQGSKSSK